MKNHEDAYGQNVWAYYKRRDSYEIVERDDGFVGLPGSTKSYFADFKDWPKWQRQGIKFAKGKILDVGCGAGRISSYLQKKDFDVTAIDNSPLAIKVCRRRGVKKAKVKKLIQSSIILSAKRKKELLEMVDTLGSAQLERLEAILGKEEDANSR